MAVQEITVVRCDMCGKIIEDGIFYRYRIEDKFNDICCPCDGDLGRSLMFLTEVLHVKIDYSVGSIRT